MCKKWLDKGMVRIGVTTNRVEGAIIGRILGAGKRWVDKDQVESSCEFWRWIEVIEAVDLGAMWGSDKGSFICW